MTMGHLGKATILDGYSEVYLFVLYFIFGNAPKSIEGNLSKFGGI